MVSQGSSVSAFICNSNMFVPSVLSEVLTHRESSFLIMSDIDNILRFFTEMDLPNAAILRYSHPKKTAILGPRRELLSLTAPYDIRKVVFFHAEYGDIINWFLQKVAKNTEICYCKVYNSLPYPKARGLKAVKQWLAYRILNGVDMDILDGGSRLIPSLPERFYKKIGARPCQIDVDFDVIKRYFSQRYPEVNRDAKIVLLTGSTVAMDFVEKEEYIRKTDALIEALGPKNCVTKCHPRFDDVFSKELDLPSIPSFIPGNLVIGNYEVFIGNQSTLLVEAAIEGKLAISLLDYYHQKNESQAVTVRAFYQDRLGGRGVVHYPGTLEEILDLVKIIL